MPEPLYRRVTLPNGVRLLTVPMAHVRSVTIDCYFGVGSRYESAELAGVAHFLEHMIFKGSAAYPSAQLISESIEGVGGALDAATDKEVTVFTTKIASHLFEHGLSVLADMVRRPLLDPAELDKERRVIIDELGMYRDSPLDWVHVMADETLWPGLPLGREVAGTRESVEAISREAMAAFHAAHYIPANLVISVAGDISHERALEAVTRHFGDWETRQAPAYTPSAPPPSVPRVAIERRKTEQTNFVLLMPALRHDDPRYFTMVVLNAILGDGMSSRLFLVVREQLGLAYDVGSGATYYHDTGAFVISAGVDPGQTGAALTAILGQLARMRDEPAPAEELQRAKEYSKGRRALRLEDTGSVAGWYGGQEILVREVLELDEVLAKLDAVTAEDIQQLARELFREEWLRLAVIGPHKDTAQLEALLRLP
jgi:predicted Zn-dependent peptidase